MCDTVIDEHFRRSLGNNYMELFDKTGTGAVSPTGAVPIIPATVAVTAVTKTATKRVAKSPPVASPPAQQSVALVKKVDKVVEAEDKEDANVNFSVDDHFAKALGETWNKLKATQRREVEVEEVVEEEEDEQDENVSDGMEEEDSSGGFSDSEDDENRSRGNRGKSNKRLRTDRRSD